MQGQPTWKRSRSQMRNRELWKFSQVPEKSLAEGLILTLLEKSEHPEESEKVIESILVQSKVAKWKMHHSVITSSKSFQRPVALVALPNLKQRLGPLCIWSLCKKESLYLADPLCGDWTLVWGLRKGQPSARKDSAHKQEQNQTLFWDELDDATGTSERILKLNPRDLSSSALEEILLLEGSAFNCWGNLVRAERFPASG